VGYPQLVEALRAETRRRVGEIAERAALDAEDVMRRARAEAEQDNQRRVEEAEEHDERKRSRAIAAAQIAVEGDVLAEKRGLLERARAAVERTASADSDSAFLGRLSRLLELIEEGPVELRVTPGREEAVRDLVRQTRSGPMASVLPFADGRVGVEARTERVIWDDTVSSRVGRVWQAREAELAAMLFEGSDEGL
jgi:vacuolar-type H+-ATPase subunit E/Vma4